MALQEKQLTIAIIGAGNVASHLAPALAKVAEVKQICATTQAHASALAARIEGCQAITALSELNPALDLYLIAANDTAVTAIASQMPRVLGIVAHTSGSVPMEALLPASEHVGVFYPLQTFSKSADVDVSKAPFFTEASDTPTLCTLDALVEALGPTPRHANSHQRSVLHVAAVFACNFANHLWAIADEIVAQEGYDVSVFAPLLQATLDKAMVMSPEKAQTGPAARGDMDTIAKHKSMLNGKDLEIYSLLTQSIIEKGQ